MPIKLQLEAPDFKYLLFVIDKSEEGRCLIIMITGICSMEECFTFISKYPTSFLTPEKKNHIPQSEEHFQHEVTVEVRGISTAEAGQKMPKWVESLVEQFSRTVQFTDAYTFHVERHFVRAHLKDDTGENLKDSQ